MDVPKIVDYIGNIDEDIITDTMEISKQKQNHMWIKWAVPAACLCITLTVLGVLSIKQGWFNSEGEKRGTVVYPNQESSHQSRDMHPRYGNDQYRNHPACSNSIFPKIK